MSTFLVAALKISFLLLMWLFILFTVNVIRVDLFGRKITAEELVATDEKASSIGSGRVRRSLRPGKRGSQPPPLPTRLLVTTGKGAGASTVLPGINEEIIIGRSSSANLDLDDDYASSNHAKIWRDADGFVVEDMESTNGTYVNGQRISQPTRIAPGDVVRVGRSQMQLDG